MPSTVPESQTTSSSASSSASSQRGILAGLPPLARHLLFTVADASAVPRALATLGDVGDDGSLVLGLGVGSLRLCGDALQRVPDMHEFPALDGAGAVVPSTPAALWCWLRGDDLGTLLRRGRALEQQLAPAFALREVVDCFRHGRGPNGHGLDLTGYEDGTENPPEEEAPEVALLQSPAPGLGGSSYAALQQWRHDFGAFEALSDGGRDAVMGRRLADNEEIDDAPASAHVKRTAQESFDPEAFVWRRSMPWAAGREAGLMFLAFGRSLYAYEAQMRRMAGLEDGIVDGIFGISKPVSGSYFWCPPVREGRLDLRVLGLARA